MSRLSWLLVAGLLVAPGCGKKEEALTPEQARAKGNALIKKMSDNIAASKNFSYTTDEMREPSAATARRFRTSSRARSSSAAPTR